MIGNYNSLNALEKKVKPPALPPKTYLEQEEEEEEEEGEGQSRTSSAEDIEKPDYENCSVGTDSLYDMEQDNIEELNLPARNDTEEGEEEVQGEELPTTRTTAGSSPQKLAMGSHYQKLNIRVMNNPSAYEDLNTARAQRDTFTSITARERLGMAKPSGGQYESLQLKSMEKPSQYQDIWTIESPP